MPAESQLANSSSDLVNQQKIIVGPNRDNLELQKEVDLYRKIADRATSQIINLQSEKQEILKINFVRDPYISNSPKNCPS